MKILTKLVLFLLLSIGTFLFLADTAKAVCCVNDCPDSGNCCEFSDCEVGGGGGGGGGQGGELGSCPNCQAGYHPVFTQITSISCCKINPTGQTQVPCCVPGSNSYYGPPMGGGCDDFNGYNRVYSCAPNCDATAPTNITVTPTSITSAGVAWALGANGTAQWIYVDSDKADVENNCVAGCLIVDTSLTAGQTSYQTGQVLSPGTVYYYRIINYKDSGCATSSTTATAISSCTLSPSGLTLTTLDPPTTVTTSITASSDITEVDYSSSNPAVATVTTPDTTSPTYQTTVTPLSPGSTVVTSDVYFGSTLACTDTAAVNILQPGPWWQLMDADLGTNGNLTSLVPPGLKFNLPGPGDYPGIPAYAGSSDLTAANVSETGWIANSQSSSAKIYYYNFFASQIPADTVITPIVSSDVDGSFFESGGALSYGFYWYKYSGGGTLNINTDTNITDRKVIILVEDANLNINGTINLTDGEGFMGIFVNGDISVNPAVGGGSPDLEGIYLSDGTFSTGTTGLENDSWLSVRGSISAYGGISMQRDLGAAENTINPAEFFEFAPDQILLFPAKLGYRRISWKEVAP